MTGKEETSIEAEMPSGCLASKRCLVLKKRSSEYLRHEDCSLSTVRERLIAKKAYSISCISETKLVASLGV